jgi:hypothetical protein
MPEARSTSYGTEHYPSITAEDTRTLAIADALQRPGMRRARVLGPPVITGVVAATPLIDMPREMVIPVIQALFAVDVLERILAVTVEEDGIPVFVLISWSIAYLCPGAISGSCV